MQKKATCGAYSNIVSAPEKVPKVHHHLIYKILYLVHKIPYRRAPPSASREQRYILHTTEIGASSTAAKIYQGGYLNRIWGGRIGRIRIWSWSNINDKHPRHILHVMHCTLNYYSKMIVLCFTDRNISMTLIVLKRSSFLDGLNLSFVS